MGGKKASPVPSWNTPQMEPKRKFKYILSLGATEETAIPAWVVKSAARPTFSMSSVTEHQFMGHTFKFPGRIKWETIDIVLMDPINPDIASKVLKMTNNAGYILPSDWTADGADKENWKKTLSKRKFSDDALGFVKIQTLNSEGKKVETWTLQNVQITKVNYGALDYGSEDLLTVTITMAFDFASHEVHPTE